MIKIELTTEQANALMQLVDIAIKAGGYQNAKVGVPMDVSAAICVSITYRV